MTVSLATILSIVSGLIGLARWWVTFTEEKKWIDAGRSQAILEGLENAEQIVQDARNARQAVRDQHARDPDSIMRDDEFTRPD